MNPRGTYRKALVETTAATAKKTRVPDAAQRLFGGMPQSRDLQGTTWTPDQQRTTPQGGVVHCIRGTPLSSRNYPLAAPTFEKRLRMRNDSSSQTSR